MDDVDVEDVVVHGHGGLEQIILDGAGLVGLWVESEQACGGGIDGGDLATVAERSARAAEI